MLNKNSYKADGPNRHAVGLWPLALPRAAENRLSTIPEEGTP